MSAFNVSTLELEELQKEVTHGPGFALLTISHPGTLCVTELLTSCSRCRNFCGSLGTLMIEGEGNLAYTQQPGSYVKNAPLDHK